MSNILTGVVQITAPGAQNTFNALAVGTVKAEQGLKRLGTASGSATLAMTNLGRVVQDAPFGFLGIANNLNPLLESFQRLKVETGSSRLALKALGSSLLGAGGLGFALSIVSTGLILFGDKLFGAGKAAKAAKSAADELRESIKGIFSATAKEATGVLALITVLKSETETRQRKLAAIQELQKIQPEVFSGLKLEGEAVVGLDLAYQNYLANLRTVIAAKILQVRLEQLITKQLELQGETLTGLPKKLKEFTDQLTGDRLKKAIASGGGPTGSPVLEAILGDKAAKTAQAKQIQNEIKDLLNQLSEVTKGIKVKDLKVDSIKITPAKVQLDLSKIFAGLELSIPPEEVKPVGVEFGQMFYQEVNDYFKSNPTDFSLLAALAPKIKTAGEQLGEVFSEALNIGLQSGLEAIGEGIGNLLSGEGFGDQFAQVFGNLLETMGKALIKFGIVKQGIDVIIKSFSIPGAVAIGLGLFAIAAGKLVKNLSGARALGGPVFGGGSYIVGERGPELFTPNTGGQITPNSALGGRGASGGGMMVQVSGQFIQRGQDLLAVITLANQSRNRLQ